MITMGKELNIDFDCGILSCTKSNGKNDKMESYECFEKMEKYYNSQCIVRHWLQKTLDSGVYIMSPMTVRSAMYKIKEGWLEKATIELEHNV